VLKFLVAVVLLAGTVIMTREVWVQMARVAQQRRDR
jgi:hypothetical protein